MKTIFSDFHYPWFIIHLEVLIFYAGVWCIFCLQSPIFLEMFDINIEAFQRYFKLSYLLSAILALLFGWLADSYIGKQFSVTLGEFLMAGGPVCLLLTTFDHSTVDKNGILLNCVNYFTAVFVVMGGVRTALLLEQVPQSEDVRRYIYYIVRGRQVAVLTMWGVINFFPFNYAFLVIHSLIVIVMLIAHLAFFSMRSYSLNTEIVEPSVVENSVLCIFVAVGNRLTKVVGNFDHWLDLAAPKFNPRRIFRTKLLWQLFITFLPLIFCGTTDSVLESESERHGYLCFTYNSAVKIISGGAALALFRTLILPLTEALLVPRLDPKNTRKSLLQHIFAGFLLLGVALLSFVALDIYLVADIYEGTSKGHGRLTIYNGLEEYLLFCSYNSSVDELKPLNYHAFPEMQIYKNDTAFIFGIDGMDRHRFQLELVEYESISVIICKEGLVKIPGVDPKFVGSHGYNDPSLPRFYIITTPSWSGNLTFTNNNNYKYSVTIDGFLLRKEYSLPQGWYTVEYTHLKGRKPPKFYFSPLGVYVLFLHETDVKKVIVRPLVHSPPSSPALVFMPLLLTSIGSSFIRTSMLHFTYLQAPPKLRGLAFSYVHFISTGELGLFIGNNQWQRKPTLKSVLIYVICLHMLMISFFVHKKMAYKTIEPPGPLEQNPTSDNVQLEELNLHTRQINVEINAF